MTLTDAANRYRYAFEQLTPDSLDDLVALAASDIVFTDPFNTVHGKDSFRHVFAHMFATCQNPRFVVSDMAMGADAVYLRWTMTGQIIGYSSLSLHLDGMSEVHFNKDGLVTKHIDHWDSASQLLNQLPYIGWLIRRILRLFRLKTAKTS